MAASKVKTPRKAKAAKSPYRVVSVPDMFTSPCRKCEDRGTLICLDANTCLRIRAYRAQTEGEFSINGAIDHTSDHYNEHA
jgi:hypothetical protein